VGVIDDTYQGLPGGVPGQQSQRRDADEKPIGRPALLDAEGQPQRGALRCRERPEPAEAGPEKLVQGREAELHLGLNAVDPDGLQIRGRSLDVIQQCRLAHAWLAPQHEDAAQPLAGVVKDLVEPAAFRATSEQVLHEANLLPRTDPLACPARAVRGAGAHGLRAARDARPAGRL